MSGLRHLTDSTGDGVGFHFIITILQLLRKIHLYYSNWWACVQKEKYNLNSDAHQFTWEFYFCGYFGEQEQKSQQRLAV